MKAPLDNEAEIRKLKAQFARVQSRLKRMEAAYITLQMEMSGFMEEAMDALDLSRPKIIITRPVEGLTDEEIAARPVVEQPKPKRTSDRHREAIMAKGVAP